MILVTTKEGLKNAIQDLKSEKVIGLDIETSRRYPVGKYSEVNYKGGLDPYLSRIVMVQIGTLDKRYVIDVRKAGLEGLEELLEDEAILKVGHNLQFEGKHFLHNGIRIYNVWDTMIADKLLWNGLKKSFSLESLMKDYLGYQSVTDDDLFTIEDEDEDEWLDVLEEKEQKKMIDKSIRLGFINIGDKDFTQEQLEYGETDITAPLRIYEIQKNGRWVSHDDLYYPEVGIRFENKVTQVLADMSYVGMEFSQEEWLRVYEAQLPIRDERRAALNTYVETHHLDWCSSMDLFTNRPTCAVDWSSPQQVTKFFRKLGLAVQEFSKSTGKLAWTVGAKPLMRTLSNKYKEAFFKGKFPEIKTHEDLILAFLLFNKSEQLCDTFGKSWLKYVHPITGRVHSNYRQLMNTTRMSSVSPNLQNAPADPAYRKCFVAAKDWKLMSCDFAAQEIRVLADVAEVQSMIDFFTKEHPIFGDDFHSYSATNAFRIVYNQPDLIVSKETHPNERTISKTLTFSLSYGASDKSVSKDLGVSEEEGSKFVKGYYDGFPGLAENFESRKKAAFKKGWFVINQFAGVRFFFDGFERMQQLNKEAMVYYPDNYRTFTAEQKAQFKIELYEAHPHVKAMWSEWGKLKGQLERKALNYSIQGTSAFISKMAALLIYNYRKQNNWPAYHLVNIIHDELISTSKQEESEQYLQLTKDFMVKAGTYFCSVPMVSDGEVSDYWKH